MAQLRAFFIYATSGYLLQGARFAAAFGLRLIADPITVGLINSAQVVSPIFTTLTSGLIFRALRDVPSQSPASQARIVWTYLVGNIVEAALIYAPFVIVCALALNIPDAMRVPTVMSIGLFAFGQRVCGTLESMFMALGRPRFTAQIRVLHLFELAAALGAASLVGAPGYLLVSPVFALCVVLLATRQLHPPAILRPDVLQAMKITRYGASLASEKILSAAALAIDGLVVSIALGPAMLAGYSLGTAVRGAIGSMANSLYWALWPQAVRDQDMRGESHFSNARMMDTYCIVAAAITLASAGVIKIVIARVLPDYAHHIPVIMIVIASTVPMTIGDWGRAQLVVKESISGLPVITVFRILLFAATFFVMRNFGLEPLFSVAYAAFGAFTFYMLAISCLATRSEGLRHLLTKLAKHLVVSLTPLTLLA